MSYIDSMKEFDLRRGKEPIDPTRIANPDGLPPPPPLPPAGPPPAIPSALEAYGEPVEFPQEFDGGMRLTDDPPPVSPLIELAAGRPQTLREAGSPITPPDMTEAELWIWDQQASYRGRSVTISAAGRKKIVQVVLKELRRSLDDQYAEIAGTPMRASSPPPSGPTATSTSPRRRRARRGSASTTGGSASPAPESA
jgi:hypothetical protein